MDIHTSELPDDRPIYENCLRCHEPMEEFLRRHRRKFHDHCLKCHYCNKDVSYEIIEKQIERNETPCHRPCEDKYFEQEFKNKPVTITQDKLDYLNRANLMFAANLELSPETNQKEASYMANLFIVDMTLDQLFITLKRMEAITAMCSIALSKDKSRAIAMIAEREREKFNEVQEYRKKQVERRDQRRESEISKTPKAKMTAEEKTHNNMVNSYLKMGFTQEQVDKILEDARKKVS